MPAAERTMSKTDPRTRGQDKTMPMLSAEQAKHILVVQSSTQDVNTRIEKLKPVDDVLNTFELVVRDLQEQKLLTRAWSLELISYDWAAFKIGHFPLTRETALLCVELLDQAYAFVYCAAKELGPIENISLRYEGGCCQISPEELATYFEAIVDLHMYLQGTIMGLQKLNALVCRECRTVCSFRHTSGAT